MKAASAVEAAAVKTARTFAAVEAAAAGMHAHYFVAARSPLRVKPRGSATVQPLKGFAAMVEGAFAPAAGPEL